MLNNLFTDNKETWKDRDVVWPTNVENTMDRICEQRKSFQELQANETNEIFKNKNEERRLAEFNTFNSDNGIKVTLCYQVQKSYDCSYSQKDMTLQRKMLLRVTKKDMIAHIPKNTWYFKKKNSSCHQDRHGRSYSHKDMALQRICYFVPPRMIWSLIILKRHGTSKKISYFVPPRNTWSLIFPKCHDTSKKKNITSCQQDKHDLWYSQKYLTLQWKIYFVPLRRIWSLIFTKRHDTSKKKKVTSATKKDMIAHIPENTWQFR